MYGTRPLYGPRLTLVRKFSFNEPETRMSATRDTSHRQIVAQLRPAACRSRTCPRASRLTARDGSCSLMIAENHGENVSFSPDHA